VIDRKLSTYGSDGEPADDVDDDNDDEEEPGDSGGRLRVDDATTNDTPSDDFHHEDNDTDVILTAAATSSASFVTSLTSSGDVRRPRTTADGCEDEAGAGAGALDLIRHVLRPADLPHHSTTWKALDDAVENSAEEPDSIVKPKSLIVDSC